MSIRKLSALLLLVSSAVHADPARAPIAALGAAIGTPVTLGVLIATTSVNNATTGTPFNTTAGTGLAGKILLLQPDTACLCKFGADSSVAATTSATGSSFELVAKERVVIWVNQDLGFLACIAVSGTSNVKVWELR